MKERIQLTDSFIDIVMKMSEGDPEALNVLMMLLKNAEKIDPENWLPGLGQILSLDSLGIYGSRIWMFYKDVCREDLVRMCAVMRARQLGFISDEVINIAIDSHGNGLNIEDLLIKVREKLPAFGVYQE